MVIGFRVIVYIRKGSCLKSVKMQKNAGAVLAI